ncbi:MAG TPA: hypothetical protein VF719_09635 [Abditibacteriaceae bacterium]|jgi:hypothetical protein
MLPVSSITRVGAGSYELRLQGDLSHPHWMAFLFSGLAASQIAVVSGHILRGANLQWDTRLYLDFSQCKTLPENIDYLALAQRKPSITDTKPPRLGRFNIVRLDNGLEATLEGPDQIGFLGRLFSQVALLGLFPTQITIATIGGRIHDRVVFQGIGGTTPNADIQNSLQLMLGNLVQSA